MFYQTWTSGGGWSGELTGPSMGGTDTPYITKLYTDPYTNTIMMGVQDSGSDLNFVAWNGSSWGTVTQLDGATGETYRQNFTYVWNRFNKTSLNNVGGDTLAYVKGDGVRVIDQGYAATITDSDQVGFNGGTLTISFTGGSTAAQDVLGILNQGSGAGKIGVSGSNVTYGGVVIGTWTGGTSGSALVITLNANATAAAVGALASNITYQNTNGTTPSTTTRTVRFALVDALGVAATPRDVSITVTNPSPGAVSVGIQQGVDGYTGTQDTYVRNGTNTSQGNNTTITFDGSGSSTEQGLIRFDSIFGNGPGQIPYGSVITSASLTVYAIEDGTQTPALHRILGLNWDESSIWSGLGSGVQFNNVEASSSADSSVDASSPGYRTFTGLEDTLQAWANGEDNLGWVIKFDGNEWIIASSENGTVAWRPQLNITYTAPAATVIDLDPNNSTGATGPDSHKTFVENGGPVAIADVDATVADSDSTQLTGMTVTLTNPINGVLESLAATTTGTSITASYDSGTGVLTLSGTDTLARYQQVLRSITYNNLSDAPDTTTRFITVVATDGYTTSATATAEITITAVNDAPTGSVSISGTPTQGQTLTASNTLADADGMGSVSYQWLRNGVATGATGSTYTLTQADVGQAITVRANYTDGQGTAEAVNSAATTSVANINDAPTGSVLISGTPTQGETLSASNSLGDADGMGTVTYHWLRDGVDTGATGSSYELSQADVGKAITVRATYTDGQGTAETVDSAATTSVANINDAPTGSVSISGTPTQGQTLTASNTLADVDGMGTVTYHWLVDGVDGGATGTTYTLTQADVGKTITVRATYTDGQGTAETVDSAATTSVANINDAPTGSVSITGTPTQGQTLTASNTLADVDGMGSITYHWLVDGVDGGATGTNYILTQADVGKAITVRATYTDGQGTAEAVDSAATTNVANVNDAPTGSVSITGTLTQGQTLTASNTLADADGMGTITYHWLVDGVDGGATGNTYTLTQADVGKAITVRATYTDGQGTAEAVDSAATANVANINDAPTGSVSISGTPTQGQTLTASNTLADVDGMGTVTYHWLVDGVDGGATGTTYTLTQADVGKAITVRATYTDGQGTAEAVNSAATANVANVNDAPTGAVSISGTPTQGQTLTASNTLADADGLGVITYHWLVDGVDGGATGTTYTLTQADVGKAITVRATYTDGQGTAEAVDSAATANVANVNDAPTGTVSISGTPTQGQTLTASNTLADADGMGSITYHWLVDGVDDGATGTTYTLTQADVGKAITVRATYTDGQGTAEVVNSAATANVVNLNDLPTGSVSVSGTITEGQTLTASNSLADADGMGAITYHWLVDGVDGGATGTTYTLTQADVGKTITVRATYTDGQGTAEAVDSAATAIVANVNDAPTGSVSITGTPTQGQTLTASNTLADNDGMGTVTYHWLVDGVDGGATGTTYTLTQADVGKAITVRATYTDGQGTAEAVNSAATANVVNVNDAPTGAVSISGTPTQGQTLTASNTLADADGLGVITYHWLVDGVDGGATGNTYTLTQADVGKAITVHATYTDGQGAAEAVDSAATANVANINDAPTGSVSITGTPTQGQTLTASNTLADVDGLGTVTYHWLVDGVDGGATGNTYTLTQADVGKAITVRATYTDGQGTAEAVNSAATTNVANVNDAPTGGVSITGTPTQGQTLTASNTLADLDGMGTVTYQWLVDGVDGGATGTTYTLTQADVGTVISVRAAYTDGQGTAETVDSAGTAPVADFNFPPVLAINTGFTVNEGAQAGITPVVLLATDPDHTAAQITYTVTRPPAHGRLELTSSPGTAISSFTQAQVDAGLVRYVHDGSETTADSLLFTVSDAEGAATSVATLSITVNPVNDAPTLSGPGAWTLPFGQPLALQGAGTWQLADVDAGSQILTATLQLQFGTLTGNAGGTAVGITGSGTGTVVLSGTLAQLNAFMAGQQGAQLVYAGVSQHLGDRMTMTLSDGQPGGSAALQSSITQIVSSTDNGPELPDTPEAPAPAPSPAPAPAPAPAPLTPPPAAAPPAIAEPSHTPAPIEASALVIPPAFDTGRPADHLSFKPTVAASANGEARSTESGSLLNLLGNAVGLNASLATGLVPVNVSVSAGDVGVGRSAAAIPVGGVEDTSKLFNMVSAETMQMSGTALSVGAVWWISRSATLLTSLLISTPVWRQLDPLPVFNSASDDEGGDKDGDGDSAFPERDAMRRAEDLFARAHTPEASEIS